MNFKKRQLFLSLSLGLGLTFGLLGLLLNPIRGSFIARAAGPQYVAPAGNDNGNDCTNKSSPCATIQHAIDVASPGDEIRVASGTYMDVHVRPRNDVVASGTVTQVVYISKSITIQGGYTPPFTDPPNPEANTTTLDAQGQGRVIYITGDITPTIDGLHLTGGNAAGLGGGLLAQDSGGGIYVITATVKLVSNQVFSNVGHARAIGENGGRGQGGGAFFLNSSQTFLSHNIFRNNNATLGGGIRFQNSPSVRLVANTVNNNLANHIGFGQKHSGGIDFASSENATLINNIISGNSAANRCGGLCLDNSDSADLICNIIINNSAGSPGFTVSEGGGLRISTSNNVNLIRNEISDNTTNTSGGGVYLGFSSSAFLKSNIIQSNQAQQGGGLYVNNSTATFANLVVADNQASATGSGLFIQDSSPRLSHTTFARNSGGDGTGIHITGTANTVTLTNTILASHTVGITVAAGNTAVLTGVLWYNNTANTGGPGTINVMNQHIGDPAFWPDGYHLMAGSAAIDKGIDAGVARDIDGDLRPFELAPDLGADENTCDVAIFCRYLPVILKG